MSNKPKRSIKQCLNLKSSYDMTSEERLQFRKWLEEDARYMYDGYDYCELLGWFTLDQRIPISPKEAGFE